MIALLKRSLYFPIAYYFRFFAGIRLNKWKPRIIVVTGSNGKTTLLHLLESQIGNRAKYSHHANSAYGIPFDILDLHRKTLRKTEWIGLFFKAPFALFKELPKQKLYVVEADCDRPGEGKFLASLLRPEMVLWVSSSRTHSMNFEHSSFPTVEEAIASEFGYFIQHCQKVAVVNGDLPHVLKQLHRTKTLVIKITKKDYLSDYKINWNGTAFTLVGKTYRFKALLPEEIFYALEMCYQSMLYLELPFDPTFKKFTLPPGRSSLFAGTKKTVLVDSCYNANLSSMKAILQMFNSLKGREKWVIVGDMLEQGNQEQEEHEKLAELLATYHFDHIILMGPRVEKYTLPILQKLFVKRGKRIPVVSFLTPTEVMVYLLSNLAGNEAVLFKGARFLEGVIERLLKNKSDAKFLARREEIWEKRRKEWGL